MVRSERGGFGPTALAREFGGVFYAAGPEVNRSNGCLACCTHIPDVVEEEKRVTRGKLRRLNPTRDFVELEAVSTEMVEITPVFDEPTDTIACRMAKLFAMNPKMVFIVVHKALEEDRRTILAVVPQAIARLGGHAHERAVKQIRRLPQEPRLLDLHAAVA